MYNEKGVYPDTVPLKAEDRAPRAGNYSYFFIKPNTDNWQEKADLERQAGEHGAVLSIPTKRGVLVTIANSDNEHFREVYKDHKTVDITKDIIPFQDKYPNASITYVLSENGIVDRRELEFELTLNHLGYDPEEIKKHKNQEEQIIRNLQKEEEKEEAHAVHHTTQIVKNDWFVANDMGDLIGHDMSETAAKLLASEMQEKEPNEGWEALSEHIEEKYTIEVLKNIADENEKNHKHTWEKCKKDIYSVKLDVLPEGTNVYNKLEDVHYTVNKNKPFVITGTAGEQWTVDFQKLTKTYDISSLMKVPEKNITQENLLSFLGTKKQTEINTRKDGLDYWCRKANGNEVINTSWGEALTANRPGVEHGSGDYVVCTDKNGTPNIDDSWIVNGEIFDKTYIHSKNFIEKFEKRENTLLEENKSLKKEIEKQNQLLYGQCSIKVNGQDREIKNGLWHAFPNAVKKLDEANQKIQDLSQNKSINKKFNISNGIEM